MLILNCDVGIACCIKLRYCRMSWKPNVLHGFMLFKEHAKSCCTYHCLKYVMSIILWYTHASYLVHHVQKCTKGNCFMQHCSTQCKLIMSQWLSLKGNKCKSRLMGMSTDDTNCFLHHCLISTNSVNHYIFIVPTHSIRPPCHSSIYPWIPQSFFCQILASHHKMVNSSTSPFLHSLHTLSSHSKPRAPSLLNSQFRCATGFSTWPSISCASCPYTLSLTFVFHQ